MANKLHTGGNLNVGLCVTDLSVFYVVQYIQYVPPPLTVFFCILLPSVRLAHNVFVRHGGPQARPG